MRPDPHTAASGERSARGLFPNAFPKGGVCPRGLFRTCETPKHSRAPRLRITTAGRVGCMASLSLADDGVAAHGVPRRATDDSAQLAYHVHRRWNVGRGGTRHGRGGPG